MADEELKERDRRSPLDTIESVGMAALAIGAGAAFLYKGGGSEYLSSGLKKANQALNETLNTLSNTALRDIDYNKTKAFVNDFKSAYLRADESPTIRMNTAESLINVIAEGESKRANMSKDLYKMYDREMIFAPLTSEFQQQFAKNDSALENRIYDFVDDTLKNTKDAVLYTDENGYKFNETFLQKHFGDNTFSAEQQQQMQDRIVEALNHKYIDRDAELYARDRESVIGNEIEMSRRFDILKDAFGVRGEESEYERFKNQVLGDRRAVVGDLLDNRDKVQEAGIPEDIMDILQGLSERDERYRNLFVDKTLRIDNDGNFKSFAELKNIKDNVADATAETLPGKLLKLRDILSTKNVDTFYHTYKGDAAPTIAALAEKRDSTIVDNNYVKILNKTFKITEENELEHVAELDNTFMISGQHGTTNRIYKWMTGDVDRKPESTNRVLRALGIGGTSAPTGLQSKKAFIDKFTDERWAPNLVKSFLNQDVDEFGRLINAAVNNDAEGEKFIGHFSDRLDLLNKFYNNTTIPLDRASSNKMLNKTHGNTKELLRLLTMQNDEMMKEVMKRDLGTMNNADLVSLLGKYKSNPKKALDSLLIVTENKGGLGDTRGVRFHEMVRKEIAKEAFLSHVKTHGNDLTSLEKLFENAALNPTQTKEAKHLANWAIMQDAGEAFASMTKPKDKSSLISSITSIQSLFSNTDEYSKSFQQNIHEMVRRKSSVLQNGFERTDDIIPGHNYGKYMYVQKAHGVKDLIKNLNDSTKTKAFFKQFVAGRHDMSNVTTASLFPYFSLLRLVDPLSSIRLGFNPKYTSSVTDLAANIMFRRVVPIALGITALSYLNFESDNITGTSLKGAAANSIANIDLGMRRVVDAFGIGERLKDNYENNVMSQYWFHDKYQTYDERKRWYQNGYSPVRKSRWWSFGSASEFRGGKIDYFQPNYLIQAHSNWQDIAIYGSSNEKWKHSWIPTPRHPLSPLRALLDPYWLERKHYWDRPYPVTGKMFEDNTPWGAILNPTVGAILKPQRKMHQRELQGTNIDVRSLIAARNASIRNKANENNNLVSLDMNGVFAPVSYYDPAYEGKQVSGGMAIAGGSNGSQYLSDYDAVGLKDYAKMYDSIESAFNSSNKGGSSDPAGMSIIDKIQISADRGNPVSAVAAGILPLDLIKGLNDSIKSRAKASGGGRGAGVLIPDAIFKESTGFGNGFDDADLRNTSTTKEMLQDAGYSSKELLGMYGFLFEQIMPGGRSSRLQSADRMSSFSRRFWDSSVGGIGGEFMEIARRFIPHENHDINRINNIQNTMPDWIPERYRFGDPYEKLPNGEMRLPGDGYEAMYKLHPDQFGNYGAFDRMKILADIAPWSKEYRIWREVAQKSVSDKYLRNEMKNIKRRVKQQSKTHTFYPYTFIGNKLEEETITVNKVTNAGVTGIGSGTTYNLAGINMTNGKLTDFIKPGQELRVKYDKDSIANGAVSAILYSNGENLNRMLLKKNVAEESDEDTLVANRAKLTDAQMDKGRFFELLGHAPIPLLHNKFMRVNSPLESWKQEQLYGTTYATWTHPIQGFIIPAFQSSFSIGYAHAALSVGTWALSEIADRKAETAAVKNVARAAFLLSNPAAFAGATTGYVLKLRNDFSNPKLSYMKTGSRIGAAIGIAGFGFTHASNPFAAITAGAALGEMTAANYFKSSKKTGALIGAAAGLAISAMKNPGFDMNKTFGPWIPKRVQKRWEIEEYYDRLRYIKYMGLYEKAARLAKRKEDINIKALITKTERDAQKREKIKKDLLDSKQKISNTYIDSDIRKQKYLNDIDEKLAALQAPQVTLKAGKYTKAALAYKQAADSTIYGLKENATMSQILRAVPKYQRDYILEFGKETNAKKRKEILKNVSPYVRKVLHVMWGDKQGDVEDNKSFFSTHNLPGTFWGGWQPDVDLDNVEIKTIKNEGMLLSDFGFYDSQSETPEAITAPGIDYNQETSALNIKKNLFTALNGAGLIGVDVSIEPSEQPGIQMVANIARISNYKVKEKINNVVGRIFY